MSYAIEAEYLLNLTYPAGVPSPVQFHFVAFCVFPHNIEEKSYFFGYSGFITHGHVIDIHDFLDKIQRINFGNLTIHDVMDFDRRPDDIQVWVEIRSLMD
jgi:hypothetical protein